MSTLMTPTPPTLKLLRHAVCEAPSSLTHSPEDDDVFEEGEEDEDDARAHPDVQRRDVAHPRSALPAKNNDQGTN